MLLIVLGVTDAVPRAPTGTIEQRKCVEFGGVYTKPTIDPTVGPACQPEVQRELTALILREIEQSHLQTHETRTIILRQMPRKKLIKALSL